MTKRLSSFIFLLGRFPRAHVAATLALAALLGAAMLVPETGSSVPSQMESFELALPERGGSEMDSDTNISTAAERQWREITIRSGDTLGNLLRNNGVSAAQVHTLVSTDPTLKELANLRVGQTLRIDIDQYGTLQAIEQEISRVETRRGVLQNGEWQAEHIKRDYQRQMSYAEAVIEDSLFLAGQQAGMTDNLIMQLANIFAWDIDFILDIRRGDHFRVLYEELLLDGEKVADGDILMAEFWNRDRKVTAFRFETADGQTEYLDALGNSMRREFIRTPVEFARISSRFNPNRRHPVLNTIRAHRGVDYAAPSGTPIRAAGDGRVEFVGKKGGYGNVIIIRHGQAYSTLYAHMRSFTRGMRNGTRVKQGQTIGYVGMTGLASGPHLHYEFLVNGVHRDPLTVKLPKAQGIPEGERKAFLVHANRLRNQLALYSDANTLAANESR
ncbi:peptidoglycan DD-metalloendopeptidase family protein [Alcanivorax sp. 1008]|uniref:peptidoglycan DD-metalloendopeptidase family protein n=1 Tax=Alcanivorax sp. 1008 TaxID=2816853 RepID=UPI001D5D2ABB|nr:peptidoglycan DD-metalloendopeptidase family protein [Alcanivorax sp. 1008]MCC1497848.1 peptidoglycan DD-metalloendopeptidase family protein [Alcanivorax sp. 1008]